MKKTILAVFAFAALMLLLAHVALAGWTCKKTDGTKYCSVGNFCPTGSSFYASTCNSTTLNSTSDSKALALDLRCVAVKDPSVSPNAPAFAVIAVDDPTPSNPDILEFGGQLSCREWTQATKQGNTVIPPQPFGPPGIFVLDQIVLGSQSSTPGNSDYDGVTVTTELITGTSPPITKRTFSFNLGAGKKGSTLGDQRKALWELKFSDSLNSAAVKQFFCAPNGPGTFKSGDTLIPNCGTNQGAPDPYMDSDFPPATIGFTSYSQGELTRYIELERSGEIFPQSLAWRPCHSGTFNLADAITCVSGRLNLRTRAEGAGLNLVEIDIGNQGPTVTDPYVLSRSDTQLVVAVLGSSIDVTAIDFNPASDVKLDGVGAIAAVTVLQNGSLDLLLTFNVPDLINNGTSQALKNASPGQVVSLTLTGKTIAPLNNDIVGSDTVMIAQPVIADLKPANCNNVFSGAGNEPWAILGGFTGPYEVDRCGGGPCGFDVTKINVATVTLSSANVPATQPSLADVGTNNTTNPAATCNSGADGITDLLLKFDTDALKLAPELVNAARGDHVTLKFKGYLNGGTVPIKGETTVLKNY